MTGTVSGVTSHVPVVGDVVNTVTSTVSDAGATDVQHGVSLGSAHASTIVSDVNTAAHGLNIAGDLTDTHDVHGVTGVLDDLHLG